MSEKKQRPVGTIGWIDITVPNAQALRDFYQHVVGWGYSEVQMQGYADYMMYSPATDTAVAGICHARGVNAGMPPQWLLYIVVDDLDQSLAACSDQGGTILNRPEETSGHGRFAVIQDPAGGVVALFEPAP